MSDPAPQFTPLSNVFAPAFLESLSHEDEAATASEAVNAGPWNVAPTREKGKWAVVRARSTTSRKPCSGRGRRRCCSPDGREVPMRGAVSHPFGIFRGTADGIAYSSLLAFCLVYLPTGRVLATLRDQRQAKDLAAELARVWVRWDGAGSEPSEDPAPIVARHVRESV